MSFTDHVIYMVPTTGARGVMHREDASYTAEDEGVRPEELVILPLTEATAEELAELIDSVLENENYHSFVGMASRIAAKLREAGTPAAEIRRVVELVGDELLASI
jgi:hypothetical protein